MILILTHKGMKKLFFPLFLFFNYFLLRTSVVLSNSVTENLTICEIYYETKSAIVCVLHHSGKSFTYLNDFVIRDTICKNANSSEYPRLPVVDSKLYDITFRDCRVRPGVFQFFVFPNIQFFTIGPNNKNPVLENNTFAGLCSIKTLSASDNSIERIEPDAFKCVKDIESIFLSNNKLHFLSPNVFKGMHLLASLNLRNNNFSTFKEGTFDDLSSLRTLNLNSNSIHYLPNFIFRNLVNVLLLSITNNNLETLNRLLFLNMTKLRALSLSYNKLKGTAGSFSNHKDLYILDLIGNKDLTLSNDSFYGLEYLTDLSLNECNIVSFPGYIFLHTPILRKIVLSHNKLREINSDMFKELNNILALDLDFNHIAEIKAQAFEHNTNLGYLTLSGNALSEIKSNSFKGLTSLKGLDLSLNRLEKLGNLFSELTGLTNLNISHNFIKTLQSPTCQSSMAPMAVLLYLDMSHNKIERISNVFLNNTMINTLDISQNPLLHLSNDSFKGLYELRILKVNHCNVTFIHNATFSYLRNLSSLSMYGNNLQQIYLEMFSELKKLRILDISMNNIISFSDQSFKHNNNLRSLHLFQNNLQKIKRGYFIGLSSLTYLDVSRNGIEKIENNSFEYMSQLELLNISHNLIYSLNDVITHCDKLIEIDVSYNYLTDISDKKWRKLVNFKRIRASHNKVEVIYLSEIPQATINLEFNNVKKIYLNAETEVTTSFLKEGKETEIYLRENLLQCDCHLFEFYKELTEGSSLQNVKFADGLVCHHPADARGKPIPEVKAADFICNITDFCPENCVCKYSAYLRATILDCNDKDYRFLPLEVPYNTNILHIKRNNLVSLLQLNEAIWENLTEIHAGGNKIVDEEFYIPKQLKYLDVSDNKLTKFPQTVQEHATRVKDFNLTLSRNSWHCDCSIVPFKTFLAEHSSQINDLSKLRCTFSNGSESTSLLKDMQYSDLCSYSQYVEAIILLSCMGSISVIASISFLIFYYKNKTSILAYLYTHANLVYMVCGCVQPRKEDKLFDCFISYSSTDKEIALRILEELEDPDNCKFCIHERNWMPGKLITTNIIESVENSRKTLILLSETFLESGWFHLEFQAAYHQTLKDREDRLILVIVGDLPDKNKMEKDLQYVISSKTYLQWEERWFWEKLRYSIYEKNNFIVKEEKNWLEFIFCCLWKKSSENQEIELEEVV